MDYKFSPLGLSTVTVVASSSGGAPVQIAPVTGTQPIAVRLVNNSTIMAYVEIGSSTVTAASSVSMPIRPTSEFLMATSGIALYVAAITTASSASLYATPGKGL